MGTAVLSPWDCLVSPYDPLNFQILEVMYSSASAPRSRRGAIQASVVQRALPSLASDYARWSHSSAANNTGALNDSTGLLPVLDNRFHSRESSQTRASSSLFSPMHLSSNASLSVSPYYYSASSATRSSSSNGKLPVSRSASTGFLSRGLGRESLNSSEDRVPLKVVQSNRVVNGTVRNFGSAVASRFSDVKSHVGTNYWVSCEDVGDLKKRTQLDFSPRGFHDHEFRKSFGKTRKEDEPKRDGKGTVVGSSPVTILQRPKTKEAADKLIASVLDKVAFLSPSNAVSELSNPIKPKESFPSPNVFELESPTKGRDSFCNQPTVVSAKKNLSGAPPFFAAREGDLATKRASSREPKLRRQASVDARVVECVIGGVAIEVPSCKSEMEIDKWFSTAGTERWAGPAYSNSPPPSSLPLPKFPTKLLKTSSPESSPVGVQLVGAILDSAVSDNAPPRRSRSLRSWMPVDEPEGVRDVAFATKNLRRMLNLDSY